MKTSQMLEGNHKARKFTLIENGQKRFRLITFITPKGNFICTYPRATEAEALGIISATWLPPEYIDSRDWKIIRTVDPMELMGSGYEEGQKVRILPTAKEMCLKDDLVWSNCKESMLDDGFGIFKSYEGSNCIIYEKDKQDYTCLPASAIEPWFEELETVKIGEVTYNKAEFEAAVKNLKPIK